MTIDPKRLREKFLKTQNPNHRLYLGNGSFSAILYQACRHCWPPDDDFIGELLEAGALVHNGLHTSPIFEAVDADNPAALAWLHKYGVRLNPGPPGPLPWRFIPLHRAAFLGCMKALEWLAAHGADLEAVDSHGRTALHVAAGSRHPQGLEVLLDHGAMVDPLDNNGISPLRTAAKQAHLDNSAILLNHGAAVSLDSSQWANLLGMADKMCQYALENYECTKSHIDPEWIKRNPAWTESWELLLNKRRAVPDLLRHYRDSGLNTRTDGFEI